jgi:sugar phosphate isomerase/epimerase
MPTLSMNEVTTYRWPLEEDVRHYAAAGYEGIGLWRPKMSDYGDEAAVDLIAESGLRVTNLLWAGGFTGSDGRTPEESVQDAVQAIRLAGALGAGCLVLYAGGRNNHIYRQAERLLRGALDELLIHAADCEVTLAIEPMHSACATEWTFLTDLESTVALLESYNSPFLKLVFDTYHFGHDGATRANLGELVPHIGIVHLGDRSAPHAAEQDRRRLGEGRLHLPELIRGLLEAGYAGDFDVELIGREIEPGQYEEVLASSLDFFERVVTPVGGK